ncbi:MAG: hypothetical protein ACREA9_29155, partial [Pyrinomonadaceae bacterium]
ARRSAPGQPVFYLQILDGAPGEYGRWATGEVGRRADSTTDSIQQIQLQHHKRRNSMAELNLSCSKCDGRMEEGFIADRKDDDRFAVTDWVEGKPEKSFWKGIKTGDKVKIQIKTYRCASSCHQKLNST